MVERGTMPLPTLPQEASIVDENQIPVRVQGQDETQSVTSQNNTGTYEGCAPVDYLAKKEQVGETVYKFLQDIDYTGKGTLTAHELWDAADLYKIHHKAKTDNRTSIDYKHFPQDMRMVFEEWDDSKNGHVSVRELQAAAAAWKSSKQRQKYLQYSVLALLLLVLLLTVSNFVTTYLAVEIGKEVKANDDVIHVADGRNAKISSTDYQVINGKLVPTPQTSGARRLASCTDGTDATTGVTCSTDDAAVAVRLSTTSQSLTSTIPDTLLQQLTKINITHSDGSAHVTLTIIEFSRATAASKCGSLVYLLTANGGTITLDDTDIYFDETLSARLIALGIDVADVSGWGRRLASASEVTGLFGFFEDYEWECTSVAKPQSPTVPYVSKTLRKTSCPTTDSCASSYMSTENLMFPGYDADTDTIISEETLVVTETYIVTIRRYPNHPLQKYVSITDHSQKTNMRFQVFNGSAYHCVSHDYDMEVGTATDALENYTASYLRTETQSAKVYQMPWGESTVDAQSARIFKLTPGDDLDNVLPITIQYEDAASTLLPTRLYFYNAKDLGADVEDILVMGFQQDAAEADTLYNEYNNMIPCTTTEANLGLPRIHGSTSPLTESASNIEFYCQSAGDGLDDLDLDSYWLAACDKIESSTRRLLNRRKPRRLASTQSFDIEIGSDGAGVYASTFNNEIGYCMTVGGQGAGPWSIGGELNIGTQCDTSGTGFTANGKVTLSYGWEWKAEKKVNLVFTSFKVDLKAELTLSGYIGGEAGSFTYDCGRRLAAESSGRLILTNGSGGIAEEKGPLQTTQDAEDLDLEEEDYQSSFGLDPVRPSDTNSSATGFAKEEDLETRKLLSPRRLSSRRRRRRRRTCQAAGFQLIAGVSISGGVSVGRRRVGVSLDGDFDMTLGPWPSPLDAYAKGTISGKACVKIVSYKLCISLPTTTVFEENI